MKLFVCLPVSICLAVYTVAPPELGGICVRLPRVSPEATSSGCSAASRILTAINLPEGKVVRIIHLLAEAHRNEFIVAWNRTFGGLQP